MECYQRRAKQLGWFQEIDWSLLGRLGLLAVFMPVWYFLEIYYVLNFMDRMRPRLLSIYTFRITTIANRGLGSILGQDETIYNLSSTRGVR